MLESLRDLFFDFFGIVKLSLFESSATLTTGKSVLAVTRRPIGESVAWLLQVSPI